QAELLQRPRQRLNFESASGEADSASAVPSAKLPSQVPGQSIPAGTDMTRPRPVPPATTTTLNVGIAANAASTRVSAERCSAQLPPLQAPENARKLNPAAGVAVRETSLPALNVAEQIRGQSMPAGLDSTEPLPETCTARFTGRCTKVAQAETSLESVRVHEGPLQAPPNPAKSQPAGAEASRRTAVPGGKSAEHVRGQSIPAGSLRTVPPPFSETWRCRGFPGVNVAATETSTPGARSHAAVPLQAPDQPAKVASPSMTGSRCTGVSRGTENQHVPRQSPWSPEERTAPGPDTATVTVALAVYWPQAVAKAASINIQLRMLDPPAEAC